MPSIPYTVQAAMFTTGGDDWTRCYNLLAQLHDTSEAMYVSIYPEGTAVGEPPYNVPPLTVLHP
jgi:hypothetical protein